jgi:hypothetical protein
MKPILVTLAFLGGTLLSVHGAGGAPGSSFQLVFEGRHATAAFPTPSGYQHEGPFTTSSPLCPSGTARDVAFQGPDTGVRVFTCAGSGAQFSAEVTPLRTEHGGVGTWKIIGGTGMLLAFRGFGTFQSARVGGDDSDPSTITFRTVWQGVAAVDATPPEITLVRASLKKLKPLGTYRLDLSLSITDAGGETVPYTLTVTDAEKQIAMKRGVASSAPFALALRVKPAKKSRALRLNVAASDAVGNRASLIRSIRVR